MKYAVSILLVVVLAAVAVLPALAQEEDMGHIYGVVFMDENMDGVWGNEAGVANVPVTFVSGNTQIVLRSAWTDNLVSGASDPISQHPADMACSHLDEGHLAIPKGCNGTLGLRPVTGWWHVYVTVPAGCVYTGAGGVGGSAANPYIVQALNPGATWANGRSWLEFPINCTATDPVTQAVRPAVSTGTVVYQSVPAGITGPFPVARMQ
jgi:hypothetical protein